MLRDAPRSQAEIGGTGHRPDAGERYLHEDTVRSLTLLNLSGDSTLAWGPDADQAMRDLIQRKMDEGIVFFVMERRWNGLLPERKVRVEDLDKAMASRRLTMADEAFADIVSNGAVQLVRTPSGRAGSDDAPPRKVKDAALAARSQCVAIRGPVGG